VSVFDGQVRKVSKLVDHGPEFFRYNIMFLGDGYRRSELPVKPTQRHDPVERLGRD